MILVECKPDKELVKMLISKKIDLKKITHGRNKSEIIKMLIKRGEKYKIGIIDEDPGGTVPRVFNKYQLVKKYNIDVDEYRISASNNVLLILKPRLEEWFLKISKKSKLRLKDYKLPEDPDRLHKIINANLKKFEKALRKLLELKSKELLKIKEILGGNYGG